MTSSLAIPVGWGLEKSTYKVNPGSLDKSLISGNFHPASSNTSGIISFTGATGAGTNWRIINQYGQVSFSGYLNSFNVSVGQGSSVTVAVDFPTICGTKTAIYIFAKSNYQFGLSPNPANNNLRVSGTTLDAATARGGFNYDVEIMSNLGQLVKNLKNVRSGQDKDIDISGLRSNQFYTIRFISNSEVVVQQFFKS